MNSSKPFLSLRFGIWPCFFIGLTSLSLIIAGSWEVSARLSVFAIDGPFQVWNPLQRILAGQLPGRDFDVFHGVGYVWLHFFPFVAMGGTFFASEFIRNLLPPLSVIVAFYPYLRRVGVPAAESWAASLFTSATLLLGLRTTLAYMVVSGASSIPLRVSLSLLALYAMFYLVDRWLGSRPLVAGGLGGCILGVIGFFTTDQTIFVGVTVLFCGSVAALSLDGITWNRRIACGFLYFIVLIPAAVTVCILLHAGACGGDWRKPLEFAYKIIPAEQVWYFGSPPFTYAKSLGDFLSPFYIIHPMPLVAAFGLVCGLWEPIRKFRALAWIILAAGFLVSLPFIPGALSTGKTWTVQCVGSLFAAAAILLLARKSSFRFRGWIWLALCLYGALSMTPNLVYETKAYFVGAWRVAATILLCGGIGMVMNLDILQFWSWRFNNAARKAGPWTIAAISAIFLAGLYWTWPDRSYPLESAVATLQTIEWEPGSAASTSVTEIGGITIDSTYGKTYASALALGNSLNGNGLRIFSTYTGVIDSSLNSRNPVSDYIVHALGTRWQEYVAAFKREKPELVQIQRRRTPGTTAYTQHTNWAFFRELLTNYKPVLSSGWCVFWKRDPSADLSITPLPEAEYPEIITKQLPLSSGQKPQFLSLESQVSDSSSFLECTISYRTTSDSPFAFLFSKFTRTVVAYNGSDGVEVFGLPPALSLERTVSFPVFANSDKQTRIHLWNENPFCSFQSNILSVKFSKLTTARHSIAALIK